MFWRSSYQNNGPLNYSTHSFHKSGFQLASVYAVSPSRMDIAVARAELHEPTVREVLALKALLNKKQPVLRGHPSEGSLAPQMKPFQIEGHSDNIAEA